MKYHKRLILFSLLISIISTAAFLQINGISSAKHSQSQVSIISQFYLPLVSRRSANDSTFGITIYSLDEAGGLPEVSAAGTDWTRSTFSWSSIEPSIGLTQTLRLWETQAGLEQGLIKADLAGVHPIMLIDSTPTWALKAGYTCGAVAEGMLPKLAQFAYDLVSRYSVPPYNVRYWELWNEPDVWDNLGCWGDPSDSQYFGGYYYGRMLQQVYPEIKRADPQAQVLIGGLLLDCDPINPPEGRTCVESYFLKGILQYAKDFNLGPNFDGISFHAYDFYTGEGTYENKNWQGSSSTTGPVSITKANFLNGLLSQYGVVNKYLMNTETAIFWGPNVLEPPCQAPPPFIEETKVDYVIQSYAVAVAKGWKANVWYSALGVRCSALLYGDLSPKAAFYAFSFARQKLGEASAIREINEYEGMMGFEYRITSRRLWIIWSKDGLAHTINFPGMPVEVNLIGADGRAEPKEISQVISINESEFSPWFIEFNQ